MPPINLLSREISELIAAGEVIERPSSVIKELVENSIDAGSKRITVEIKRGGSTFIRITDDGCGISFEDVPKAFLRHATSKITSRDDLNGILTLGFRGEALASVCAVSKTEIMTKPACEKLGTHYIIEGSDEVLYEKTGCPDGTTIIIRDLFYNVPARRKFMKKDTVEGNMVCNIVNKIALSHPDISFKLLRDNKMEFSTAGDGKLYSAVFAVYGKTFANDMVEVDYEQDGIKIYGYTVKPLYSKANRVFQNFFVNDRYIRSQVCASAVEEAYKGVIMVGKFPACVLKIDVAPDIVDVNVHPAKVEIRFSDDRPIYDCLYFAVKSALMKAGLVYDFQLREPEIKDTPSEKYEQPELPFENTKRAETSEYPADDTAKYSSVNKESSETPEYLSPSKPAYETPEYLSQNKPAPETPEYLSQNKPAPETQEYLSQSKPTPEISEHLSENKPASESSDIPYESKIPKEASKNIALTAPVSDTVSFSSPVPAKNSLSENSFVPSSAVPEKIPSRKTEGNPYWSAYGGGKPSDEDKLAGKYSFISNDALKKKAETPVQPEPKEKPQLRFIGEVFKGYILAEIEEKMVIIDKHAAHERIIFERLKSEEKEPASQLILCPEGILLSLDEAEALAENSEVLENMGFKLDLSNSPYVSVKAVPTIISHLNMDEMIPEIAENLRKNKRDPRPGAIDDILHTIACKAAIKMNDKNNDTELKKLAEDVYFNEKIRHCPHGRPVMFVISKYDLEKQFKRIV